MITEYLLKPAIIGQSPEITISEQDYLDAKRCHKQNYEAFEIELAFDFVVKNYIEIEKYIAEHLVLDMTAQMIDLDSFREQQYGFIRLLSSWLASISFWHDISRNRLIKICGRGTELEQFKTMHTKLQNDEFVYAFIFYLRDYSQHGGFPITGSSRGGSWDKDFTQLNFSASYTLNYENIRSHFEGDGKGSRMRKKFGKKIEEYSDGKPFDLKPIIRQSLGSLGRFMDCVRSVMKEHTATNESFILEMIERFSSCYPDTSLISLSAMPVDDRKIVADRATIIPIRDEFIVRSKTLREKNNEKSLGNMEKRIISNV